MCGDVGASMQAYMLGGAYLGGSTVDLYQLKGNIDQVLHPPSHTHELDRA